MDENDTATTETTTDTPDVDAAEPTPEDYDAAIAAWRDVFDHQQADNASDGDQDQDQDGQSDDDTDDDRGSGEAAKYRRRLRDTEAERDTLRQRVEHMQRAEIERLAAGKLADPADVWRDGAKLADLLDDTGNIDPDKVNGTVDGLLEAHAHWGVQQPTRPPRYAAGGHSGASGVMSAKKASWSEAIRGPGD